MLKVLIAVSCAAECTSRDAPPIGNFHMLGDRDRGRRPNVPSLMPQAGRNPRNQNRAELYL